ncbi:unnamed protein product [Sympodiomycopsis kandeliae]
MLVSSLLVATTAVVASCSTAGASPVSPAQEANTRSPQTFPLVQKRSPSSRHGDELLKWANNHRQGLHAKYGLASPKATEKRAEGESALVNFQDDSTWYAMAEFGTPAKKVNMVLDTGSADIWISEQTYKPSSSSTYKNESSKFSITYGSGEVTGHLGTETISLADHTVSGQTFAVADGISSDLLDGTTSGILGLGFQALSTSKATPFWSKAGETEFSFYLRRASASDSSTSSSGVPSGTIPTKRQTDDATSDTAPGGYFTLGGSNTSLYQGDINWSNVITKNYWLITLGGITVGDNDVNIGSTNKAAIDTGTTLIGGPTSVVEDLYAQIPGSGPVSNADGYYQYPCDTEVNATMTFGTQKYSINSKDFTVAQVDTSGQYCMGSFFALSSSPSSTLQWVVGGAFLKSVYSVFKDGDVAQVGFAALADNLESVGTSSVTVPKTTPASSGAVAVHAPSTLAILLATLTLFALL